MDNLGAIGGPLLALALVAAVGIRTTIVLSVIPGLLAAGAIVIAIRSAPKIEQRERRPLRIRVRPVLQGPLGRLFYGIGAFELGNAAATLLILRATDQLDASHSHDTAVQLGLALYAGYNLAAALTSLPAGGLHDRRGSLLVLALGVICFLAAYVGFAAAGASVALLAVLFLLAGNGQGARRDRRAGRRRRPCAGGDPRLRVRAARGRAELRQPRRLGCGRRSLDARLPARSRSRTSPRGWSSAWRPSRSPGKRSGWVELDRAGVSFSGRQPHPWGVVAGFLRAAVATEEPKSYERSRRPLRMAGSRHRLRSTRGRRRSGNSSRMPLTSCRARSRRS